LLVPTADVLLTSATTNAIDSRSRIACQKELDKTFKALLDEDIVQQVEAQGWITRIGRLFKAGVRMIERIQKERASEQPLLNEQMDQLDTENLELQVQVLAGKNAKLRDVLEAIRGLLNGETRN
jgi:predicted TIM-barrel fold metal-dependent hydrolase